jgi:hypothetical protein
MDGKHGRAHVVNNGEPVPAAPDPSGPPDDAIRREIARRWEGQCGLDEVVGAVRGESERAVALALAERDPSCRLGSSVTLGCSR